MKSFPHKSNACAGAYSDWLEVMLTPTCNGCCEWCVEQDGWHPTETVHWVTLFRAILKTGKPNISLLGGEPTLYKDLGKIIRCLAAAGRKVYVTTNGSRLTGRYVKNNLQGLKGLNVSIHCHDLKHNKDITGISLRMSKLKEAIAVAHALKDNPISVRFNCNTIKGHIDSVPAMRDYVDFAKECGADSVRFAELRNSDKFVNLAAHVPRLSNNPFRDGCSTKGSICGLPVEYRLMCGAQTPFRAEPRNPVRVSGAVMYYDGKVYEGWQKEKAMSVGPKQRRKIKAIVKKLKAGKLTVEQATDAIERLPLEDDLELPKNAFGPTPGGGCMY